LLDDSFGINQTHYALSKLNESGRSIKQAVAELPLLRKRLEKHKDNKAKASDIYNDLKQQFGRLLAALRNAALSLLEMDLTDEADYTVKLGKSIGSFNLMTPDYSKLCDVLSDYLAKNLPTDAEESKITSAAVIGRLMNSIKMGYYPTDLGHIEYISNGIFFPEDIKVNLFDPCCGCGLALRMLAGGNDCDTYGIELDGYRAEEALTRLDRVGFGSYYRARISNEAFHLMLLNPPYLSVMTEGGNNTRSEKRFLVDSLSRLMYGGLIIYIIPYYRLTSDICRILCDNFDDLTVHKFTGGEFKKYKQVAVMGIRRKRQDGASMAADLASLALEPDNIAELTELPEGRYVLPAIAKKVEIFKGADFNVMELAEQLNRSKSFTKLFEKSKLDSDVKRPLLPLSLSQIGLIGGSGLINGLVECETPHIIKGRIVKQNNVNMEENTNSRGETTSTTMTETRSNKMVFNLLTPKGFISLSDYGGSCPVGEPGTGDDDRHGQTTTAGANAGQYQTNKNDNSVALGRVVITANAGGILSDWDINKALSRHKSGDWGEVCKDDWKVNDDAVRNGFRILSAYTSTGNDKFWVITEADRSYTTVLMPDDY